MPSSALQRKERGGGFGRCPSDVHIVRTDLDQIGATYPELEWAMDLHEHEVDVEAMRLTPRQQEALAIYDARHADNRHKVDPPPVCPVPRACR